MNVDLLSSEYCVGAYLCFLVACIIESLDSTSRFWWICSLHCSVWIELIFVWLACS